MISNGNGSENEREEMNERKWTREREMHNSENYIDGLAQQVNAIKKSANIKSLYHTYNTAA